jgi:hypothetical protein
VREEHDSKPMNIFLVPAPPENVKETLAKAVTFERAAKYLDHETLERLFGALGGQIPFHCWAATEGKNSKNFELMSRGDEFLFAVTGTGQFEWRAQLRTKFESEQLGRELWPHLGKTGNQRSRGDKPWKLIYVVDNLTKIKMNKREVLKALGYTNPRDDLGSLRRVRDKKVINLIARFGSIDAFVRASGD